MHVEHRLSSSWPGVEHDAVTVGGDPLGGRHLMRLRRHLGQQAAVRGGQRGQVGVVILGDHQNVRGGLRVDVPEGDRPGAFGHPFGRDVTGYDLAEEAVGHLRILARRLASDPLSTLFI